MADTMTSQNIDLSSWDTCIEGKDVEGNDRSLRQFISIFWRENETPVWIAGLRAEILTPDLPNTKQATEALERDFRYMINIAADRRILTDKQFLSMSNESMERHKI
jgi:hypothetical protein